MIEIALSNVSAVPSAVMADLRINGIKGGNLLYPTELAFCCWAFVAGHMV